MAVEWLSADLKAESDAQLTEGFAEDMERAKAQGLDAVRQYIRSIDHELFTWKLLPISYETLEKLLKGEFKKFDELKNFNPKTQYKDIELLYRYFDDKDKGDTMYIIDTIFIDG